MPSDDLAAPAVTAPGAEPLVGVQVGAISFVDEGVEPVLEAVQGRAAVNTLFVATQAFDRGVQGRPSTGMPWPGHGPRELDDHRGGSYVVQHPEFYRSTVVGPYPAPDAEVRGFDVLGEVLPPARRRGLSVYAFMLENTHSGLAAAVPSWSRFLQVDADGALDRLACLRNPAYVDWWLAMVEDQVTSYPLDGLMFGSERQGPLGNTLGRGGFARDSRQYCFCRYCLEAGAQAGVDPTRAREGFGCIEQLVAGGAGEPDRFGTKLVHLLALLLEFPEVLMWERLWHEAYLGLHARIYGLVKLLRPDMQVGWHLWHHMSFSPLYRAQMDYDKIAAYSDFVKPVVYNTCGGYRLRHHTGTVGDALLGPDGGGRLYEAFQGTLSYSGFPAYDDLDAEGLPPSYVAAETARALRATGGRARVYPGIDVNVGSPPTVRKAQPEDVSAAVEAALGAGAHGVVLSRKYSEMTLANLDAAGRAVNGWKARR